MIKKLCKSIREYKKSAILTPLIVSIEVVMECLMPLVIANLIDQLEEFEKVVPTKNEIIQTILIYGGILVVMAMISLSSGYFAGKHCATASSGFAKNLRQDVYYNIQEFSFGNIDKYSTSSLITRLTTDIANVQQAFMMIIRTAVRAPLMLIFALILSFSMHPFLPFVFFFAIPFLGFGLFLIAKHAMPIFKKVFKKYDNLNASIQENVKGMRVVKSYVREEYEMKKFDNAATDVSNDFTKAERILALNNPLMSFSIYVCKIIVAFVGANIIIKTNSVDLNIAKLTTLITYSIQIFTSLMVLSMIFVMITMASESARRIVEIIDEKSTLTNPENPVYEVKDGSVEFKNVNFKYNEKAEKYALSNINLNIKSGETIGILGSTGSSKTTLINLISRLYDVTTGEVTVGGLNVKEYDLESLRNQVAVVLQKNVLFSGTIKENLRWGNEEALDEQIEEVCKLAQADEFIQSFPNKYDTYIEQGGSNVSGGQKQRLCIARALLKKPKILILDDSTSAVDTKTDAMIRASLKKFIPETTKIIIAQRVASVEQADRIIVMDNGTINDIGTHNELIMRNDIYKEVYYSQNKIGGEDNAK